MDPVLLEGEVKAGIPLKDLCPKAFDLTQTACTKPFSGGDIGRLGIHVDQPVTFLHSDQIIFCLPFRFVRFLAPNGAAGNQQLFTPAGVFHMADLGAAVQLHMGDKPVGPCQEFACPHIRIFHCYHCLSGLSITEKNHFAKRK